MALGPATQKLVLLITIDCCRADHVSCNGYQRPTTPALDGLAAGGVNFPRACSTAGLTPHSFPGILLSNFYQNFGRGRVVPSGLATLAEVFQKSGWHTVGFSAGNPYVSHLYGYDRGFAEFSDFVGGPARIPDSQRLPPPAEMEAFRADCRDHPDVCEMVREWTGRSGAQLLRALAARAWHLDAGPVVDRVIQSLAQNRRQERLFYWVHLMDLHQPVYVRRSRPGRFGPTAQQLLNAWSELCRSEEMLEDREAPGVRLSDQMAANYRRHYDAALGYVDIELGRLFNFLRGEDLFERSLLCVTADHGQELFEDGVFGHWFGRPVNDRLVRVPLILGGGLAKRLPDWRTERTVSTLDVGPTLLDLCDVRSQPETFLGSSLADEAPRPAYGQSFYDGTDPRRAEEDAACICIKRGAGRYRVGPYQAPVRQCLNEMTFCVQERHLFRYDRGRGEATVLEMGGGSADDLRTPPLRAVREQTESYFRSTYHPAGEAAETELCDAEKESVVERLRGLGYL